MIYMVEMELPDRSEEAAWHDWYLNHIRKLLTVPGFTASQRFVALHDVEAPFLAFHEVANGDVFTSAGYRAVGGPAATGKWRELMTNWSRNLFEGVDETPDVGAGEVLLILDDPDSVPADIADKVTWLRGVGLDRNVKRRGIAVVSADYDIGPLAERADVRCYKPLTEKVREAA